MFGESCYDGYCDWPGSLATMMFYSTSLSSIYTLWLMNISTTCTLWSIYEIASWICLEMYSLWSLGWSQLNITQVSLLAPLLLQGWQPQGSLLPVYWQPPALPCPSVPLLRGSSQGYLGYSPACWPSQFPCLSGFRNVDQSLLILVLSFLQDYVEKSHPPPPYFQRPAPTYLSLWNVCVCMLSCDWLFVTPWATVCQVFQAITQEQVANSYSRGSSRPRDQTHVSCIGRWILYHWVTWEALTLELSSQISVRSSGAIRKRILLVGHKPALLSF